MKNNSRSVCCSQFPYTKFLGILLVKSLIQTLKIIKVHMYILENLLNVMSFFWRSRCLFLLYHDVRELFCENSVWEQCVSVKSKTSSNYSFVNTTSYHLLWFARFEVLCMQTSSLHMWTPSLGVAHVWTPGYRDGLV